MKNRLISLFAVLLAFAALATAFVSCKKTSDPAQDGTASDTVTGEQSQAPEGSEELLLRPEKKSFDRKYTMLVKENEFYQHLYTWDSEERPKEIMDVACWQRQTYLAENYGIELVVANQGSNAAAMLANDCAAGSNLYDVAFLSGKVFQEYVFGLLIIADSIIQNSFRTFICRKRCRSVNEKSHEKCK